VLPFQGGSKRDSSQPGSRIAYSRQFSAITQHAHECFLRDILRVMVIPQNRIRDPIHKPGVLPDSAFEVAVVLGCACRYVCRHVSRFSDRLCACHSPPLTPQDRTVRRFVRKSFWERSGRVHHARRRGTGTRRELSFCQSHILSILSGAKPAKKRSALFFSSIQRKWKVETGNFAGGVRDRALPRTKADYLRKHRIL